MMLSHLFDVRTLVTGRDSHLQSGVSLDQALETVTLFGCAERLLVVAGWVRALLLVTKSTPNTVSAVHRAPRALCTAGVQLRDSNVPRRSSCTQR